MIRQTLEQQINSINAVYGDALDRHDYEQWIQLFSPNCLYAVQSRENFDRNLPLSLIRLESHNMMRDRIFGCMDTIFHQPYYQRHVIGHTVILKETDEISARTNYSVFRTKPTGYTDVFNVGCYHDRWILCDEELKIAERICVYDSEMILNALIYPI